MSRRASMNRLESKLGVKEFKKDYKVTHDMFRVVRAGDKDLLEKLLSQEKTEPDLRWSGWTLLHRATETGQDDVVKILLEHGADVNARTIRGWHTPLHLALSSGYLETSLLLVDHGADLNLKNKYKMDPSAYAISRGYNILAAEFNQILFNRRITAISNSMIESKEKGEVSTVPSGALSRQSSVSWHDWSNGASASFERDH